MAQDTNFLDLNLDAHLEKKNGLDYLPWALVWREFIKKYPLASWHVYEFNGLPACYLKDGTAFVKVGINTGHQTEEKTCWLPVMDNRNTAIANPNAFSVNKAIMRCLVKAAAMFGLGLNVYNGEKFDEEPETPKTKPAPKTTEPTPEQRLKAAQEYGDWYIAEYAKVKGDTEALNRFTEATNKKMQALKAAQPELFDKVMKTVGM